MDQDQEQDVPTYTYLHHSGGAGGDGAASLLEDVEMTSATDNPSVSTQYICLDTNVFLRRFGLIKALYTAFCDHGQGEVALLIPFVVINELDGLTANHAPAPHNPLITISEAARAGTAWLLEASRSKTGAIRFQRWAEMGDRRLTKGDDRVLDCCLFFRAIALSTSGEGGVRGRGVVLWTDDRNLALLAEANEISTASGAAILPMDLMDRLPISVHSTLRDYLASLPIESFRDASDPDRIRAKSGEDDMELDLDLDLDILEIPIPIPIPNPLLIHMPMTSPGSSAASHSPLPAPVEGPFPFPMRRTSPTKPSPAPFPPLPFDIASPLAHAFIPFYDSLPLPPTLIRRTFSSSSSPHAIISTILAALSSLPHDLPNGGGMNVPLLKTISAFRMLAASIDPQVVARRPRTGEVADALDQLRGLIVELGGIVNQEEVIALSSAVRDL